MFAPALAGSNSDDTSSAAAQERRVIKYACNNDPRLRRGAVISQPSSLRRDLRSLTPPPTNLNQAINKNNPLSSSCSVPSQKQTSPNKSPKTVQWSNGSNPQNTAAPKIRGLSQEGKEMVRDPPQRELSDCKRQYAAQRVQ